MTANGLTKVADMVDGEIKAYKLLGISIKEKDVIEHLKSKEVKSMNDKCIWEPVYFEFHHRITSCGKDYYGYGNIDGGLDFIDCPYCGKEIEIK